MLLTPRPINNQSWFLFLNIRGRAVKIKIRVVACFSRFAGDAQNKDSVAIRGPTRCPSSTHAQTTVADRGRAQYVGDDFGSAPGARNWRRGCGIQNAEPCPLCREAPARRRADNARGTSARCYGIRRNERNARRFQWRKLALVSCRRSERAGYGQRPAPLCPSLEWHGLVPLYAREAREGAHAEEGRGADTARVATALWSSRRGHPTASHPMRRRAPAGLAILRPRPLPTANCSLTATIQAARAGVPRSHVAPRHSLSAVRFRLLRRHTG
jgi:hypothetical protein